ncbi:MAG: dihydropyrimidinase [Rhodospirillales bacterium]|jgi:dihydropyrimidinase|nr:dihydropyrimidinase [Rhodospirillales bacterium]MDP6804597.1 dihydropyrimidinase [Rhodospirillales bacterium]
MSVSTFDTIIRGGRVATAGAVVQCDIGIRDGRIAALADSLEGAANVIDAEGRTVTPGGVDGHCHIDQPNEEGWVCADDFFSGTRSALAGGTTTVMPFAQQFRGRSLRAAVDEYRTRAEGNALVDYAVHMILSDPSEQVLGQELPALIRDGYTSFKIYMTYDDLKLNDRQILDVLALARREAAMVMVHAENADCITWLTDRLEEAGKIAPMYHATSRPGPVEREATHRAITLSELLDVPILLVHVSAREAVDEIQRARSRGLKIFAETCPQYLFLTEDDLDKPGFEGAKCICSPPPRDKANQQVIWDGLRGGTFDVLSSDHAPTRFDDDKGKKVRGTDSSFRWVPNGVPGLETRMPLLFSEGVGKGVIDLERFVALTATNQAKIYGIYPQKGTIAVGSDADIVIWDDERETTITNDILHHDVDYTPYEGMKIKGWPAITLSRGDVVWADGEVRADRGRGAFIPCALSTAATPLGRPVAKI